MVILTILVVLPLNRIVYFTKNHSSFIDKNILFHIYKISDKNYYQWPFWC